MKYPDDLRLSRAPDVVSKVLDGEAVLLNLDRSRYFGLNTVATRFWELIELGSNVSAVRSALEQEFDVEPARLAADLDELIAALASDGLIIVGG